MQATLVHIRIKPENIAGFIEATRLNHEASIQEHGNVRFDILQLVDDSLKFILYEAYRTATDAAAHKATAHYLAWRDAVVGWMAEPRHGVAFDGLFPAFDGNEKCINTR